ncbi:MAG TPA: LuxR family transcriptional regulator [Sulfurovum sp.]|nr:LuxR family transcriptional regulator [Sulfurovum sp.]
MTEIKDIEVLQKIIDFQSCIIEGKTVKSILHKHKAFFLEKSGADMITLYMHEHSIVNPEYILEEDREFEHLIHKYIFSKKNFKWNKFVENCNAYFASGLSHERVTEMYQIFKGYMTKKEADAFTKELNITSAVIIPIYAFGDQEIMGYCCFVFRSDHELVMEKLRTLQVLFQTLVRPLYDKKYNTIYSKCIRIDENMNFLTSKEKKIVKKVLAGHSYANTAEVLNISINTLKTHMKNIFNKYAVTSKIELFNKFHIRVK